MKIFVSQPGLYRVTRDELQAAGFTLPTPITASLSQLHLSYRGKELPIEIEQQGDDFALYFYAGPIESIYSSTVVYWLSRDNTVGLRISTRKVKSETDPAPAPTFPATLGLEQDLLYLPEAIGNVHWFWQALTAPVTRPISVNLPALHPASEQLQVALAGETTGSHYVRVSSNNQLTGEARWQGNVSFLFEAALSNLKAGQNTITLDVPGGNGLVDVVFLDSIQINYSRELVASSDLLEFRGAQDYRVRGFSNNPVSLYDISDPQTPQKLEGFGWVQDARSGTLTFRDDLSGRQYLALTTTAFAKPARLELAAPNDLLNTEQQADYLIISPARFSDALQPLVKYRTGHGLKVRVADIEQIYDDFSHGEPDPHAIRDFITFAREHWSKPAPRFVLLVGKASYDYRDNLKAPNPNLVPTFLVPAPHIGEAASDDWFVASSDSDPHPALAIGRIPAKSPEQVSTVIDKIIAYEADSRTADWHRRAVFVTDNQDPSFDASSDQLIASLPQVVEPQKIYLSAHNGDLDSTRADLLHQWNAGTLLMTYIGHGSIDTWAAGPLFSTDNLGDLANDQRFPILLTPTCLDGYFYHPEKDSLAEALLFMPNKGIVAGLVPTGLSLPQPQDILMQALFAELFAQPQTTLGEAITRAKQKLDASSPDSREVLQTFVLLGDPALEWTAPQ